MTEYARASVLPDYLWIPRPGDLLSLLLVWDEIEIEDRGESFDTKLRAELRQAGLIREFPPPIHLNPVADPSLPDNPTRSEEKELAESNGLVLATGIIKVVREAHLRALKRGFAPVAATPMAALASCLPAKDPDNPVAEASLIQAAVHSVSIAPDTPLDRVLDFRERNKSLMGRFRGALIDLSAALDLDSPSSAAEQAHAVLRNRIEPAIGELTAALDKGRLRFAVEMLIGATSISLSPADPASKAMAGGALMRRSLRYAFDREQVVRDHPFGLLYRARTELGGVNERAPSVVTDPEEAVQALCAEAMLRLRDTIHKKYEELVGSRGQQVG